jgi:hypothetical protein
VTVTSFEQPPTNEQVPWSARALAWGSVAAIVVIVGVVPLALDRDSFPLSTYPMFSSRRSSTETVDTAIVVDAAGDVIRIDPRDIAGTDEVILAAVTVSDALRDDTAVALCRDIVTRLDTRLPEGAIVRIVTEKYDAIEWYGGDRTPLSTIVHADCAGDE